MGGENLEERSVNAARVRALACFSSDPRFAISRFPISSILALRCTAAMVAMKKGNRDITDFFKPFTVPKNRVPVSAVVEDEIVVAPPPKSPTKPSRHAAASPARRKPASPPSKQHRSQSSSPLSSLDGSTPARPTPRGRKWQPGPAIPSLDGAADEDLYHSRPSPSKQRSLSSVEIPSPKIKPMAAPQPKAPTIFSSFGSSLSSLPLSTQSTNSSRRIVKDGVFLAVTNSDSGSADGESDELADMDTFVARKKRKLTPPGQKAENAIEIPSTVKPAARQSSRHLNKSRPSLDLPPSPPKTVYKHSLLKLVKQNERREKSNARIAEAEAELADLERRRVELAARDTLVDGRSMAAMAEDSEEGERMMMAMERTGALEEEQGFRFFGEEVVRVENVPFPGEEVADERWGRMLQSERSRIQACLTGFVAELAALGKLSSEVVRWFGSQVVLEQREDLCESYVEIGRASVAHPASIDSSLSTLDTFYTTARSQRLKRNNENLKSADSSPTRRAPVTPSGFHFVMRIISYCAPSHGVETICKAVADITLATLDERIQNNAALRRTADEARASLLDSIASEEVDYAYIKIRESLFSDYPRLSEVQQCQAVTSLPATTARAHALRRHLALHLVLQSRSPQDLTSLEVGQDVLGRLKTAPEFAIHEQADYTHLLHLIGVLDIAIDAGFSDFAFLSSATAPTKSKPAPATTNIFLNSAPASSEAEVSFNAQIDALTKQVKLMTSRIKDAGATHLRRTETKSALERLSVRLEVCVRTRARARRGVFGGGKLGEQRAFLEGFVGKAGGEAGSADDGGGSDEMQAVEEVGDAVSVVPIEMLSDREESGGEDVVGGALDDAIDGTTLIGEETVVE